MFLQDFVQGLGPAIVPVGSAIVEAQERRRVPQLVGASLGFQLDVVEARGGKIRRRMAAAAARFGVEKHLAAPDGHGLLSMGVGGGGQGFQGRAERGHSRWRWVWTEPRR